MARKNYSKAPDGTTLIVRPRNANETVQGKYRYGIKNGKRVLILPGPRSTNEIFVTEESKGALPGNEKDASLFSLATADSCIVALRALYGTISKKTEKAVRIALKKVA